MRKSNSGSQIERVLLLLAAFASREKKRNYWSSGDKKEEMISYEIPSKQ